MKVRSEKHGRIEVRGRGHASLLSEALAFVKPKDLEKNTIVQVSTRLI